MNKKKFYISDVASIANALNIMSDNYDKELRKLNKMNKRLKLTVVLLTSSVWAVTAIAKRNAIKINSLEAEITNLKEGHQMTEGE